MYNTKFILEDGRDVFPGYMDKEKRTELKEEFGVRRSFMQCGCRTDKKLYYRISEDLKIYPEHNNYEHDPYCSRYRTETGEVERKTAYVVSDEDGEVTTYLTFNPKNLATKEEQESEQDNPTIEDDEVNEVIEEVVVEGEKGTPNKQEKKEPKLSLSSLIRSINVDTYTERVLNNRKIDSRSTFSKLVFYRMKKVRVSRMQKSLGDLTLESDGVRFIYLPFTGIEFKTDKGLKKCYVKTLGPDAKEYNNFIFPETLNKAAKEFGKRYGIEPNEDTIIAGFQYYKASGSRGYRVLGRIHFFQISTLGIYCRSLVEKEAYDSLAQIVEENKNIKFWIPPEDESVGGVIEIKDKKKKILVLFRTKKADRVEINTTIYEPMVVGKNEPITKERLEQIIKQMD